MSRYDCLSEREIERFWNLVERLVNQDHCWNWQGQIREGYGRLDAQGRSLLAHRISYSINVSAIPEGLVVDHICHSLAVLDNECVGGLNCTHRRCVNPRHLSLITPEKNNRRAAKRLPKLFCQQGHLLAEPNLVVNSIGGRSCRTCRLKSGKAWRLRNPEKVQATQNLWRERNKAHVAAYNSEYRAFKKLGAQKKTERYK
jgi:hypothetical protein